MIVPVDQHNVLQAATVHSVSWIASHRSFCAPDFVSVHTPERQQQYVLDKMRQGSRFYLLVDDLPVGVVSVNGCLIEDLYVLPEKQRQGYGTKLLQWAIEQCAGVPTLWILENNRNAMRFYEKHGFRLTGRINAITDGLSELELASAFDSPYVCCCLTSII